MSLKTPVGGEKIVDFVFTDDAVNVIDQTVLQRSAHVQPSWKFYNQ